MPNTPGRSGTYLGSCSLDTVRIARPRNFEYSVMGHSETTAHTVAAALALLALHEDEQDKAVRAIWEALPDGRDPVSLQELLCDPAVLSVSYQAFDDFDKLDKVLACFHEAGRMFRQ